MAHLLPNSFYAAHRPDCANSALFQTSFLCRIAKWPRPLSRALQPVVIANRTGEISCTIIYTSSAVATQNPCQEAVLRDRHQACRQRAEQAPEARFRPLQTTRLPMMALLLGGRNLHRAEANAGERGPGEATPDAAMSAMWPRLSRWHDTAAPSPYAQARPLHDRAYLCRLPQDDSCLLREPPGRPGLKLHRCHPGKPGVPEGTQFHSQTKPHIADVNQDAAATTQAALSMAC